jgi:hypothetical protein
MHKTRSLFAVSAALLILVGCGETVDAPEPTPPPVEDTAFGEMVGTMDKARAIEDTTMRHKEELDRQLDDAAQ